MEITMSHHAPLASASGIRAAAELCKVEELMRQKFRAKCLFRALVRRVMNNMYWLSEGVSHYEGDNVKMRVEQAMRATSKAKSEQLLNLNDKAILNKPAQDRTDHEKKYLYRLIGGFKCFKRYPNIVKKKLAAVTYFKYYGPGRVIVKQHQEAHALYFIMSGEVIVSLTVFDELMQQHVSVDVGQMGVGTMFGEVSLLHNIPRTATCTTSVPKLIVIHWSIGHCEFLQLMKEDFKSVLQHSVQKQWDTIKLAMTAFTYFNGLDEVSRRECCIVSKMKSFKAKDTILGDNVGVSNFVYFVLSGRCHMIESLQIYTSDTSGHKEYKLFGVEEDDDEDSQTKLESKYFQCKSEHTQSKSSDPVQSNCADPLKSDADVIQPKSIPDPEKSTQSFKSRKYSNERSVSICPESLIPKRKSESEDESKNDKANELLSNKHKLDPECSTAKSSDKDVFPNKFILDPHEEHRRSIRLSLHPSEKSTAPCVKTYFMQVCEFLPGSSFGFGENMRDRRIVALTNVDVLMMPTVWLLQRNMNNIWTRIRHYLDKKIPSKKEIFKEFVSQRRWQEYKDKIVKDVVRNNKRINYTTIHDVPYSIRMEECLDL